MRHKEAEHLAQDHTTHLSNKCKPDSCSDLNPHPCVIPESHGSSYYTQWLGDGRPLTPAGRVGCADECWYDKYIGQFLGTHVVPGAVESPRPLASLLPPTKSCLPMLGITGPSTGCRGGHGVGCLFTLHSLASEPMACPTLLT